VVWLMGFHERWNERKSYSPFATCATLDAKAKQSRSQQKRTMPSDEDTIADHVWVVLVA
jgi:hypothetical protein